MQVALDVSWPQNHRRGILTTDHPSSSYGLPVLVFDGQAHGPGELPPETTLTLTWRRARTGPVWAIVAKAQEIYPLTVEW